MRSAEEKIVTVETLRSLNKENLVFTNGCFDILHAGHVSLLQQAVTYGDSLVVGVNSDRSVSTLKGPSRPVIALSERMLLLAALECVDYVVSFDEDDPCVLLQQLRPAVHIKGADYEGVEIPEQAVVEAYGGKIVFLPFVKGLSTSNIIATIQERCSS